jgi:uncharacterized protein YuzE
MRMTYDGDADAAYLAVEDDVANGSAVENVVIERPGRGDIVLDFDADGRLLGVEIIGATGLLRPAAVAAAIRFSGRSSADVDPATAHVGNTGG